MSAKFIDESLKLCQNEFSENETIDYDYNYDEEVEDNLLSDQIKTINSL